MTQRAQIMLTPILPTVPDSLEIEEGSLPGMPPRLPLAAFPEAALRKLGRAWTEALVAKAKTAP